MKARDKHQEYIPNYKQWLLKEPVPSIWRSLYDQFLLCKSEIDRKNYAHYKNH